MLIRAPADLSPVSQPLAAAPQSPDAANTLSSAVATGLLWAAVLFNLLLCFVDTNVMRLSPLQVIAAEAVILGAALLLPFARTQRGPGRMDFLLITLFATWLLLSILRQSIEPKYFRDVAIIPIFMLLGMACNGRMLHQRLFWLHMVVLAFAIWEAISPGSFVRIFSIADYFASTRGTDNSDWWVESGLYLSAVRPEARFLFDGLALHRLSSVFLEPVSLGNYVVISTIWLAGYWQQIPRRMRIVGAIATVLLLIGSDSRMATVSCLAILAAFPLRRHISRYAPVLTAPVIIAAMFLAVSLLGLETGLDNFEGRIAHAVQVFKDFTLDNYAGISLSQLKGAEDAGFAYIVMSQSLIIAPVLWCSVFLRRLSTHESRYVHLAVALYVALNLTVSWSLFSIKTAALLWFLLGRSIRQDQEVAAAAAASAAFQPPPPDRTEPHPPRPPAPQRMRVGALSSSR